MRVYKNIIGVDNEVFLFCTINKREIRQAYNYYFGGGL